MSLPSTALIQTLPSELILHILSFLDIPELLNTSRTSHHLRHLSLDPILHTSRLLRASLTLSRSIPCRPPLADLIQHRIYVTKTSFAARSLGRNLIKIKLNHSLLHRPSPEHLVEQGVLPRECLHTRLAPSLISTKRRIERERVKDVLRHWIEEWRRKGSRVAAAVEAKEERPEVRVLVRRFAREGRDGSGQTQSASGLGRAREREREREREMPTRAKVLGLTRFWEKVGREGVSSA